ncbi:MAG: prepilin-type N-terminal cleavage/methylation domain-containing protein [Gammaproteobacteria bacterium]|nr:prepilin-type N-terminal cleavage/methylation domain-containing protein [Gammaproteobacteria bacterium]
MGARAGSPGKAMAASGFTLVEVMVVLALLALLAGLAAPNLLRLYEGFERATERGRILDQVAGLGERAMLEGVGLVLLGSDPTDDGELPGRFSHYRKTRPDVPEGWWVVVAPPLVVHANGVCLGAVVELGEGERQVAGGEIVELRAPHCRMEGR